MTVHVRLIVLETVFDVFNFKSNSYIDLVTFCQSVFSA